jgi:hypothetical protein
MNFVATLGPFFLVDKKIMTIPREKILNVYKSYSGPSMSAMKSFPEFLLSFDSIFIIWSELLIA